MQIHGRNDQTNVTFSDSLRIFPESLSFIWRYFIDTDASRKDHALEVPGQMDVANAE